MDNWNLGPLPVEAAFGELHQGTYVQGLPLILPQVTTMSLSSTIIQTPRVNHSFEQEIPNVKS